MEDLRALVGPIEAELLSEESGAIIESVDPREPVVVRRVPERWEVVGTGNYAAVFAREGFPDWVVKCYAPGRPGIEDEAVVYEKLGAHPSYSRCVHVGGNYLVLRRLSGLTIFEHLRRGIRIPAAAIDDIDRALDHARAVGLHPHDVHAKNVMIDPEGRGLVVDVSDFGHLTPCTRWDTLKRAWRWIYVPFLSRWTVPLPLWLLDGVRRGYRRYRRLRGRPD
jgi:hypothetical protein